MKKVTEKINKWIDNLGAITKIAGSVVGGSIFIITSLWVLSSRPTNMRLDALESSVKEQRIETSAFLAQKVDTKTLTIIMQNIEKKIDGMDENIRWIIRYGVRESGYHPQ